MACSGLMCNIFHRVVTLGGDKSSPSGDKILTLGFVVPWGIGVGSGICGVASCTRSTCDIVLYIF